MQQVCEESNSLNFNAWMNLINESLLKKLNEWYVPWKSYVLNASKNEE